MIEIQIEKISITFIQINIELDADDLSAKIEIETKKDFIISV